MNHLDAADFIENFIYNDALKLSLLKNSHELANQIKEFWEHFTNKISEEKVEPTFAHAFINISYILSNDNISSLLSYLKTSNNYPPVQKWLDAKHNRKQVNYWNNPDEVKDLSSWLRKTEDYYYLAEWLHHTAEQVQPVGYNDNHDPIKITNWWALDKPNEILAKWIKRVCGSNYYNHISHLLETGNCNNKESNLLARWLASVSDREHLEFKYRAPTHGYIYRKIPVNSKHQNKKVAAHEMRALSLLLRLLFEGFHTSKSLKPANERERNFCVLCSSFTKNISDRYCTLHMNPNSDRRQRERNFKSLATQLNIKEINNRLAQRKVWSVLLSKYGEEIEHDIIMDAIKSYLLAHPNRLSQHKKNTRTRYPHLNENMVMTMIYNSFYDAYDYDLPIEIEKEIKSLVGDLQQEILSVIDYNYIAPHTRKKGRLALKQQELQTLRDNGASAKELATQFNCSTSSIYQLTKKQHYKITITKAERLRSQGLSYAKIGAKFGCSRQAVHKLLTRNH